MLSQTRSVTGEPVYDLILAMIQVAPIEPDDSWLSDDNTFGLPQLADWLCPTEYAKRRLLEVVVKGEVNERFVGVGLEKGKWVARVYGKQGRGLPRQNDIRVGTFLTKEEAVLARDRYIIDNGLEWARDKLNVLSWKQEVSPCQ